MRRIKQDDATLNHAPNITKGSLLGILAFFCMAVFGIFTKLACQHGDPIWVSFITYFVAATCTTIFILPKGLAGIKSQHYRLLFARAIIGTIASFLYMISLRYIPIVNATLLFNTAPIFIPFLTVFILKAYVPKHVWFAVLLGFIGILIIVKPGKDILTDPGNLIGLASGCALAIAYLIMKLMTATETGLRIIFYYFGIGTLMQIPLLWFASNPPPAGNILYAILAGFMLIAAQLSLIRAYTYATASQVGVYQYSSVVFVALIDWLFWSITPGITDFIGFVLVSIAGIFIILNR